MRTSFILCALAASLSSIAFCSENEEAPYFNKVITYSVSDAQPTVREKAMLAVTAPFRGAAWCAQKTLRFTKNCVYKTYRAANGAIYLVGLTAVGIVIYCWVKGKWEEVLVIERIRGSEGASEVGERIFSGTFRVPGLGTLCWQVPESIKRALETALEKEAQAQNLMKKAIEYIQHEIELIRESLRRKELTTEVRTFYHAVAERLRKLSQGLSESLS